MSIEVERKRALGDDTARLSLRLIEQGWRETGVDREVDTYYSRPDVDYLETVECLRVRRRGDVFAEITYKPASTGSTHSATGVISKQETNLGLVNAGAAADAERLLEAIGMVPLARVDKERATWRHQGRAEITIAIDTIAVAGTFVEVEVISDEPEMAAQVLTQVEEDLSLSGHPVVTLPYRDIVLAAQRGPNPTS
ncbi:class IV adenylate cyclase [Nocardiopsis changdeensis]|uniref:class IV adenylate cyclase n=1 Tax=Nocardiopsis changdeensis TaxID=2831969 RepID=UPI003F462F1E